ncbi:tRNA (cytidine/uridine-2'-O-)-methyltransferase [Ostreococcus tauri]|uniref:tRNA (Cytidine/uridine-2'-O-)-methyltransferase n=1 Tax=Ostreococcus tauri TaxID=70448 RepID=A0A090M3Z8_OSTTA|nr:tRNA (cytidine/uridine-2'-O-)-methyltransferase [Ostreococcus tauri]CEF98916.1 tRNA (cytidine/uridine-2'-O-)-methyltransferase [Ostreococcus tauri]|eukprot:XP_003081016.2 tRNA (cytidine/uridine-2'-O-)-methyltransferase [Ostreococcus tauri]
MAMATRVRAMETATTTQRDDLAVVLVEPRIPGNTGCVARSCAAARVPLHLVDPLFELDDARLKRAGLDYWKSVCVRVHPSWEAFYAYWRGVETTEKRLVGFSKLGARPHAETGAYRRGDWLLFGSEDKGLREDAMEACRQSGGIRRIPIDETHVRSLNLSVSAGIGIYEALRQLDGPPV